MFFMLQIFKSCVLLTLLTPIEVTRHFHFIENSFTWDVSQSSEMSIPKVDFFSLQLTRSKVTSSNHRCPMSLERCLEGLGVPVAKALNVAQGLPQKTGCKHGPGKTARTWFGHLVRIGRTSVNAGKLIQNHTLPRMMYDVI